MTPGERAAVKATLRAALRRRARGLALTAAEDFALIRLERFKDIDPHGARLVGVWAAGVPAFTTAAHCERCCTKTLLARI
jgi:hypothetical protein